jgi:hypothetical protein
MVCILLGIVNENVWFGAVYTILDSEIRKTFVAQYQIVLLVQNNLSD